MSTNVFKNGFLAIKIRESIIMGDFKSLTEQQVRILSALSFKGIIDSNPSALQDITEANARGLTTGQLQTLRADTTPLKSMTLAASKRIGKGVYDDMIPTQMEIFSSKFADTGLDGGAISSASKSAAKNALLTTSMVPGSYTATFVKDSVSLTKEIPSSANFGTMKMAGVKGAALTIVAGVQDVINMTERVSSDQVLSDPFRNSIQKRTYEANISKVTLIIDNVGTTLPSEITMNLGLANNSPGIPAADSAGNSVTLISGPSGALAAAGIEGSLILLNYSDSTTGAPITGVAATIIVVSAAFAGASSIILTEKSDGSTVTLQHVPGTECTFSGPITVNSSYDVTAGSGSSSSAPPCFAAGTRVLTQSGYKAVEDLVVSDRMVLSDGRSVPFQRFSTTVDVADSKSAPYQIAAHAFGRNKPAAPIALSGRHKIQIRKGVWTCPELATGNKKVSQYGIGEAVTYYHIRCPSFFSDNLVTEGLVVESLGLPSDLKGAAHAYTWNARLKGLTRSVPPSLSSLSSYSGSAPE